MSWFNEATWVLFASIGLTRGYMARELRGMSALRHEIGYSSELLPGDTCYIETTSLKGRHGLRNHVSEQVSASCRFDVSISTELIAHRATTSRNSGLLG